MLIIVFANSEPLDHHSTRPPIITRISWVIVGGAAGSDCNENKEHQSLQHNGSLSEAGSSTSTDVPNNEDGLCDHQDGIQGGRVTKSTGSASEL